MFSLPRFLVLGLCLAGTAAALAQDARDRAVELTATVNEAQSKITLLWNAPFPVAVSQVVYRRLKDEPAWVQIATPAGTSYEDTVTPGVSYEYRVSRIYNGGPGAAHGYVSAGIRAPLVAERGKVILLVDDTVEGALAAKLTRFEHDLAGDGWTVVRQTILRTALPPSVRATIQAIYQSDPAETVALILFGHIPVPYSGYDAIDGHPNHVGAWPTDVYYGDVDGTWTDTIVNTTLDNNDEPLRNRNILNDGVFDQTIIPSDVELQVGRIDLAGMPAFKIGEETDAQTEIRLLGQYLDRDHQYRHRLAPYDFTPAEQRGLVDDHFRYANGEAFSVTSWRSFTACVGAGNVVEADWFSTLPTAKYLWAYGCGPGTHTSAGFYNFTKPMAFDVGETADFATNSSRAVFNVLFGSYFGDWDTTNNFLRAPLAGTADSLGLTSAWAGRPHWVFHAMALGETIGYAARASQNNSGGAAGGYDANVGVRRNHIALLGDPTLRLYPVTPPTPAGTLPGGQAVAVSWTAPAGEGPIEGYLLARAPTAAGPFVRLRSAIVPGTSYLDRSVTPGATYTYLVRAVKLQTSPTGTYLNPSQGVISSTATAGGAAGPEIEIAGNGNAVSAGDTGALVVNGTDFGAVETTAVATQVFTITNAGSAPLNIGNAVLSGSQAAEFTVASLPPATLAAGSSATFQIEFHPSANGPHAATFTLTCDDADEATYAFALAGTGLPPHAEIAIYPPVIDRSIHAGDTVVETLHIGDPGPGALVHTIDSSLTRYAALDSDSFGGPTFAWENIALPANAVSGFSNPDDAVSADHPLGFSFPFYGSSFTTANIGTNGYLSFNDLNANPGNGALPALGGAANMVAAFWTDLLLVGGSGIYRTNPGGKFILQFQDVALYGNQNARLTCQAILKPTGEIIFQYQTLLDLGSNYTVGIQNGTKTEALPIAFNQLYAHPGLAVRIRPPNLESWVTLAANAGTVEPGGVQSIAATINTAGLAPGNYYAELTVNSNAQGNATVIVPVRLTVGNTPSENWRLLHFGSASNSGDGAEDHDFDHDGRSNLLEYALLSDPAAPDASPAPIVAVNGSGYATLQFQRDKAQTDLRLLIEATSDLATGWSVIASSVHGAPVIPGGAHSCVESGSGNVVTVVVEDTAPAATFARRFLRLRVLRD